VDDAHGGAGVLRGRVRRVERSGVRLVARGHRGGEVHPELRGGDHQRGADVVAVAEVGEAHTLDPSEPLPDRHHVRERLARVRLVGETVDDGDLGVAGELVDVGLGEGPDHDRVEVAREHEPRVLDRLAAAELEIRGRQVEPDAAELPHPGLERDPGAGRGLLEDHPERPAGEEAALLARRVRALQLVREVEHAHELVAAPVGDPGEVPALEVAGDRHRAILVARPAALDGGPEQQAGDRDDGRDLDDEPRRPAVRED
jgi:hypothetical protein